MALDLAGYEQKARDSVKAFWGNREAARRKQIEAGKVDQGNRAAVTAGKNLLGFVTLMIDVVHANGLPGAEIMLNNKVLTLPGYFRPTKLWDFLVLNDGKLIAALEFKSQVGAFGNNFNNRTEESIGTAHDLWVAHREGALGARAHRPFLGWLMLIEDSPKSRNPVRNRSPHFKVFPEFSGASYSARYDLLCKRLVSEGLYTSAAVLASPSSAETTGDYTELSEETGLRTFVARFAAHIAAEAALSG